MSKVLIKTMIAELGAIIPQDELDKIADKITEVIDLKTKAARSNIDPLAKSERVKSSILQLGNIKEEIIEKLYDHGVEEPDKIRALTMKTMQKIDKAMESKYVIKDEVKTEEPVIVQDPTAPKQGEASTPKEDKDKVDDGGNNIISNIPENKPALQHLPNKSQILNFIDGKFKIALNERPNEIQNIYQKYKEEKPLSGESQRLNEIDDGTPSGFPEARSADEDGAAYPLEFKKSIIKANKIFRNIDEYFDIPDEVPTPTFEEIFNAVEQTKEKRKLEKLINLSEIIEDNRREKEAKAKIKNAPVIKGDLPERHEVPEDNPAGVSEELPPPKSPPLPKVQRISKLKFK